MAEGDTDVPYLTERESFREVLINARLTAALQKLNLRDGRPWLDDDRITRACRELDSETVAVYSEADPESLHVK